MTNIKQRRVKVGTKYSASGYGRGEQTKNVYLIDGKYYAYYPKYAAQQFTETEGEFKGYVRCNRFANEGIFYQVDKGEHAFAEGYSKETPIKVSAPKPYKNLRIVEEKRFSDNYGTGDSQSHSVFTIYRDFDERDIWENKRTRGNSLKNYFAAELLKKGARVETLSTREFAQFIVDGLQK